MAEKIRVTIVLEYDVTPGEGGWQDCGDIEACVALDRAQYEEGIVGPGDLAGFGDLVSLTFAAAGDTQGDQP
jgi:hypothetical protein